MPHACCFLTALLGTLQVSCSVSIERHDDIDATQWWRFGCDVVNDTAVSSTQTARHHDAIHAHNHSKTNGGNLQSAPPVTSTPDHNGQYVIDDHHAHHTDHGNHNDGKDGQFHGDARDADDGDDDGDDDDDEPSSSTAVCGPAVDGPRLVAVLERVQSGLLGATLSAMGITGLYITFVYGKCGCCMLCFTAKSNTCQISKQ